MSVQSRSSHPEIQVRPLLKVGPTLPPGGGGGLWPVGGWVTLVLRNLAQSAYSPPRGGGVGSAWVGGLVGGSATLMENGVKKWQKFPVRVVKSGRNFRSLGSGD